MTSLTCSNFRCFLLPRFLVKIHWIQFLADLDLKEFAADFSQFFSTLQFLYHKFPKNLFQLFSSRFSLVFMKDFPNFPFYLFFKFFWFLLLEAKFSTLSDFPKLQSKNKNLTPSPPNLLSLRIYIFFSYFLNFLQYFSHFKIILLFKFLFWVNRNYFYSYWKMILLVIDVTSGKFRENS